MNRQYSVNVLGQHIASIWAARMVDEGTSARMISRQQLRADCFRRVWLTYVRFPEQKQDSHWQPRAERRKFARAFAIGRFRELRKQKP